MGIFEDSQLLYLLILSCSPAFHSSFFVIRWRGHSKLLAKQLIMTPISLATGLRQPADSGNNRIVWGILTCLIMQWFFFFPPHKDLWNNELFRPQVWDCFLKDRTNKRPHSNNSHTWNSFLYLRLFCQSLLVLCGFFSLYLMIFRVDSALKNFIPAHQPQT